jgi:prophage tail gpP-like protein
MRQDSVALQFNGMQVANFESYSIDSDLLFSACAFTFEISGPEMKRKNIPFKTGMPCKLLVNGHVELNGVIETIERNDEKGTRSLKISGRDLMGLLVDACCELSDCDVLEDTTIVAAARQMVRKLPFISRKNIIMQAGVKNGVPLGQLQVEPGMKIFEVLSRYGSMRNLVFYSLADGTLIFGKPKSRRLSGDPRFTLTRRLDGKGNNVKSLVYREDISKAASDVIVVSQGAGGGQFNSDADATLHNSDFPSTIYKPLVVTQNGADEESPQDLASYTMEKMRRDMLSFVYKVAGHSQGGANWAINNFVSVNDEDLGFRGDLLLYGRTFTGSKENGSETQLRLGKGGLA